MIATCSLISSRRSAGVLGKVAIRLRALVSCSIASTSAERAKSPQPTSDVHGNAPGSPVGHDHSGDTVCLGTC
jgi:hypothetical protein